MTDIRDMRWLTIRTCSCLQLAGIYTIEDIAGKTLDDLKKVRNLGMKSYNEIVTFMVTHGYEISEDGRFVKFACGPDYCELGGEHA